MNFTIQQKVTIWQQFDIEADSKEHAIKMLKKDPRLSNVEPTNNIERLDETELVLVTELYEEGDTTAEGKLFTITIS